MAAILKQFEPFLKFVPGVHKPEDTPKFEIRIMWTGLVLLIFLAASQIPLWGIQHTSQSDPLFWFRTIFASQRGTLMELGTGPMMFTGLIVQMLTGMGILDIDPRDKKQAATMSSVQKLLTMVITVVQAVLHVVLGMYGSIRDVGIIRAIAIIIQLTAMSGIVMMLDELCSKGWGIASGVSLLTATNVCENFVWKCFSIASVNRGKGKEYEGAIIAFFHLLIVRKNKLAAIWEAFTREGLPNLLGIASTVGILALVVYLQNVYHSIALKHSLSRQSFNYPIKLLYTANTPVMFQSALTSYIFMISQFLSKRFPRNIIIGLLGTWKEIESRPGQLYPVGGLVYLLSAPSSLKSAFIYPIHTLLYTAYKCITCGLFSKMWVQYSSSSPERVAADIKRNKLVKPGVRPENMKKVVAEPINMAAPLGGAVVGFISVVADVFGAVGSGTGLLLAASTISEVTEKVVEEMSLTTPAQPSSEQKKKKKASKPKSE